MGFMAAKHLFTARGSTPGAVVGGNLHRDIVAALGQ
jgi:hypothetical protein